MSQNQLAFFLNVKLDPFLHYYFVKKNFLDIKLRLDFVFYNIGLTNMFSVYKRKKEKNNISNMFVILQIELRFSLKNVVKYIAIRFYN